jgi:hypothetical protein
MPASELLDISQGGAANAKLLSYFCYLYKEIKPLGKCQSYLANISTDLSQQMELLENTNYKKYA